MLSDYARIFRIFGFVAFLFIAAGQLLHAGSAISSAASQTECSHHSDAGSDECPSDHSCCHSHVSSLALCDSLATLPEVFCRPNSYTLSDDRVPDGSLKEIDYPPQLS